MDTDIAWRRIHYYRCLSVFIGVRFSGNRLLQAVF